MGFKIQASCIRTLAFASSLFLVSCTELVESIPVAGDIHRHIRVSQFHQQERQKLIQDKARQAAVESIISQEIPAPTVQVTSNWADAVTFIQNSINSSGNNYAACDVGPVGKRYSIASFVRQSLIVSDSDHFYASDPHEVFWIKKAFLVVPLQKLDPASVEVQQYVVRCQTSFLEKEIKVYESAWGGESARASSCFFVFSDEVAATRFARAMKAAISAANGEVTSF